MEENYSSAISKKKLSLIEECTSIEMSRKFTTQEEKHKSKKKKRSSSKNTRKKKKKSKDKSKNLSQPKFNLHCEHDVENSQCVTSQKDISHEKEEFSRNLSTQTSLIQNSQSINFNNIVPVKIQKQTNSKLGSHSKQSKINFLSDQEYNEHFNKILHEVKKILKKDIIGKRKLKYIFKKQKANIPFVQLRSFSEDKSYTSENEQKREDDETQSELNTLKNLQSGLAAKARKSLNKKLINPVKSSMEDIEILENKNDVLAERSPQSKIISRTPSPALPILKDNIYLSDDLSEKIHQVSLIRKINVLEELPELSLKPDNNLKFASDHAKYLTIDSNFLNTSTSSCKPHIFLANSSPINKIEISNSLNKSNISIEKTFSLYQLSSDSISRSYSQCLTPLRISSPKQWSPVFLLQNNSLDTSLKKDILLAKNNKESLINPIQSSSVTTSSESKSPNDKISQSKTSSQTEFKKCENGSLTSPKKSKSPSSTISEKSQDKRVRSSSQNSTHTFTSSSRYSRSSSHSSRSSSVTSKRQSSPVSSKSSRSRSPSIPRRHGSPSFLDRRRITSARKKPIPYRRPTPSPSYSSSPSDRESNDCSSWSTRSRRSSQSSIYSPTYLFAQCSDI